MESYRFDGQVVAVTGAAVGLGEAYADHLAQLGATVIVNDLDSSVHDVADRLCSEGGRVIALAGDIRDPATAQAIIGAALEAGGRIDAIINNAGIGTNSSFIETPFADFQRIMEVNYYGPVHLIRAAWPHMVRARYGRIVNVISSTLYGYEGRCAYAATKGAILGLSRSLALEGKPHGILVNMVAPSAATPMMYGNNVDEAFVEARARTMPPAAVAPTVAYLAHSSCDTSGRAWLSAGGTVAPFALASNEGVVVKELTIAGMIEALKDEEMNAPLVEVGDVPDSFKLRRLPQNAAN